MINILKMFNKSMKFNQFSSREHLISRKQICFQKILKNNKKIIKLKKTKINKNKPQKESQMLFNLS